MNVDCPHCSQNFEFAYLKLPPAPVPAIVNASSNPADWLTLSDAPTLTFKDHDASPASAIIFQPLYVVHHERYSVYWELSDTAAQAPSESASAPATDDASMLDRVVIATQPLNGRNPSKTFDVAYPLPRQTLTGQQNVTVRFQGTGRGLVGGLFGLRLEPSRP